MNLRRDLPAILLLVALVLPQLAAAQGFSAYVLPPRFEDSAAAGQTYRNVIEIQNTSPQAVRFGVRTADWDLDESGEIGFDEALAPDSCRPWVGLEALEIKLEGNGRKRFRFEVAVPEGTPARQCRFAIMIEGDPQETTQGMSVSGRIGVVVYLDIGDVSARLRVLESRIEVAGDRQLPALLVANEGTAHGRLQGFVDGRDAQGRRWTFAPASHPILPGRERIIVLSPIGEPEGSEVPPVGFPVVISGSFDWRNERIPVDMTVGQ
ncbi:hypothetical protein [Arenimonas sp.]|uniref:hypothetical protein n=1 Tax=Arenimonas sp. TaxID=1872635 RepID=UPI0035B24517